MRLRRRAAPAAQRRLAGEPKAKPSSSLPRSEISQFLPASRFIKNSPLFSALRLFLWRKNRLGKNSKKDPDAQSPRFIGAKPSGFFSSCWIGLKRNACSSFFVFQPEKTTYTRYYATRLEFFFGPSFSKVPCYDL